MTGSWQYHAMDSVPSIRPLPPDAIAQIKSSITITSLNAVVIELLKNSLDAHSNKIDVSVEYDRGNCIVEDDGLGIPPAEFKENGGLGKLYRMYTSEYVSTCS
jgi:DNA mismatch repair protein MLH3